MTEEPLDNDASEWRSSIKDWLREGVKIHGRLVGEATRHAEQARAKRKLARVLRKALEEIGFKKA